MQNFHSSKKLGTFFLIAPIVNDSLVKIKARKFMNNFGNKITVWVRLFPKIVTLCPKIWPLKVSKAVELLTRGFQATSDF